MLQAGMTPMVGMPPLLNAIADAEAIARRVNAVDEGTARAVCKNPGSKRELRDEVMEFLRHINKQKPPRVVLVFFAGHGIQDGDKIYMVPTKADPRTQEQLSSQCVSHDELFGMLKKGLDEKIQVGNILYLIILDVCRSALGSSTAVQTGFSPVSHEPLPAQRPDHWVLFTSTSRRDTASDGQDGDRNSPFTQAMMSVECGLFEHNVPLDQALKLVCARLERLEGQKPCLMPAQNIPDSLYLQPRKQDMKEDAQMDVFLCYRDGGVDRALAERLRDKLARYGIDRRGADPRPFRVFLEAGPAPPRPNEQVADALTESTVILLLVSHSTFDGVENLEANSSSRDRLVQLLWRYEMALELFYTGFGPKVVPLLMGRKKEESGNAVFEFFDESNEQEHARFWPIDKIPDLAVTSIVKNALDGLRRNARLAKMLADKMLDHVDRIPSIICGRGIRQCVSAFSSTDNFTHWKLQGSEEDALKKICIKLKGLVEKAPEKRKRDNSGVEGQNTGAASKIPKAYAQEIVVEESGTHHYARENLNPKRQDMESTSDRDDSNELIVYLKSKGFPKIAKKFCDQMRMSEVGDFVRMDEEDWEDPDLLFLKRWEKKKLIRLAAARIAHCFSSGCEDQINVQVVPKASTDSSTDLSSEDTDSDDDVAVAVRNLGNLDDLVTHLKLFIGELMRDGQQHMSFCMILWIVFLKDARYKRPHDEDMEQWLKNICKERRIGEKEMAQEIHLRVSQKVNSHPLLQQVKDKIRTSQKKLLGTFKIASVYFGDLQDCQSTYSKRVVCRARWNSVSDYGDQEATHNISEFICGSINYNNTPPVRPPGKGGKYQI